MDNSLNEFSVTLFIIQMGILFLVITGIYLLMRARKRKLEQELNDDLDESL
jgi:hypothetical protein